MKTQGMKAQGRVVHGVRAKDDFDRMARQARPQVGEVGQRGRAIEERDCGTVSTLAAREPQVMGQINSLARRLDQNAELMTMLEQRLEGVLRPTLGAEGSEEAAGKDVMAPCADRLRMLVERVEWSNLRLERLLSQLEV